MVDFSRKVQYEIGQSLWIPQSLKPQSLNSMISDVCEPPQLGLVQRLRRQCRVLLLLHASGLPSPQRPRHPLMLNKQPSNAKSKHEMMDNDGYLMVDDG